MPSIPVLAILVVEGGMAVEEGAAPDILAGNAHAVAGNQQRGVGQVLGHAPVDRQLALAHRRAILDDLLDAGMQREALRETWSGACDRRFSSLIGTVVSQFSM